MIMLRRLPLFLTLLTLLLVLAACYQVAPEVNPASQSSTPTPIHISQPRPANTVVIDGSAIVAVLVKNVELGFESFTPGYTVQIGNSGTSTGFSLFCEDKSDIQMAVRTINGDEVANCLRHGIDYLQITIAYDALAVVSDTPIGNCVSATELTFLYTHDTTHLNWDDIRSGLAHAPVKVFAPPGQTAAAQFFAEQVLQGKQSVAVPDIQKLITNGNGLGYMPLVQARQLNGRLPVLSVDSGTGCVAPSENTVWDGSYSFLSRPLYLYLNRQSLRRSEVFRFVSYMLSIPGQQRIGDAGFITAPAKTYEDAQAALDNATQNNP
jgi:phosphate transport system substrate-binding protein